MPNRDGTGPQGQGPMTGRGMGPCNDKDDKSQRPINRRLGTQRMQNRGKRMGK